MGSKGKYFCTEIKMTDTAESSYGKTRKCSQKCSHKERKDEWFCILHLHQHDRLQTDLNLNH